MSDVSPQQRKEKKILCIKGELIAILLSARETSHDTILLVFTDFTFEKVGLALLCHCSASDCLFLFLGKKKKGTMEINSMKSNGLVVL